jgi:hypothetical protein
VRFSEVRNISREIPSVPIVDVEAMNDESKTKKQLIAELRASRVEVTGQNGDLTIQKAMEQVADPGKRPCRRVRI